MRKRELSEGLSRRDFVGGVGAAAAVLLAGCGGVLSKGGNDEEVLPIALIVDDGVPCINALYYYHKQVDKIEPTVRQRISISLLEEFITCAQKYGVRGDFSVIPYPAGLGPVTDGLAGYDRGEMKRWIELVRENIMAQFDIHPELLTHTLALDLKTNKLLDTAEHIWMAEASQQELAAYFARAMTILKEAGVPGNGITQPCFFKGDEQLYARAILAAEKQVNNRRLTHYFMHVERESRYVGPSITYVDKVKKEAVVSVPSGSADFFWPSNFRPCVAQELADGLITEDGQAGRLVELFGNRSPIVFHTHWQSLASNGSHAGMRGLELVAARINEHFGGQVRWMKLSEIAQKTVEEKHDFS